MSRIIHGFKTKYAVADQAIVESGKYSNGQTALVIKNAIGEPLMTATVNLVDYGISPDEGNILIYGDYSEHEGLFAALHKAGIVGNAVRIIPFGPFNAEAYECPLLVEV
jgi:hypothetical protein